MRPARRSVLKCIAAATALAAWPAPAESLDPLSFFSGRTRGEGTLKVVLKAPVPIRVESRGTPDGNGGLVLEQVVREGTKPPRRNRWVLHPTSPTSFAGTLTDAAGPVRGSTNGRVLTFHYKRKDGTHASHVLTLRPDGRTMTNRMTIKRLGIAVARVEEVIRKLD